METKISVIISLLFVVCLCLSGSFGILQTLPTVNAASPNPTSPNSTQSPVEQLNTKMAQISSSNNPEDIATLAYIWGFPLVSMERQFNFVTSPNVPPGVGRGPANSISCARDLINASFSDVVTPNSDTLYCQTQFDLTKEPVVMVVPPTGDRYSSFQLLDAYTNVFAYVGTRATGGNGGTYLLAGPQWNGRVPEGMTKIWSPTNLAWLITRILVKGPSDVANVRALDDKIIVKPLSLFQTNQTTVSPQPTVSGNNASKEVLIGPQPYLIPSTGIKIFDEIGAAMNGNPLNPPDPPLVTKLASIGIGPGKTPSVNANGTLRAALQTGITEGQKLINQRVANSGTLVNGWLVNLAGIYGTDYLFRAAVTQFGLGANVPQEASYPAAFTDSNGKNLTGANNYVIHFKDGQPPVDGFWSISMYNEKNLFVNNLINRYAIGKYTEGLKNNTDGSLDIYMQNASPGKDKESNWLPSPQSQFNIVLREYLPQPQILNGTWQLPTIQRVG